MRNMLIGTLCALGFLSELRAQQPQIQNAGFEEWTALPPNVARQENVQSINLVPANHGPAGWTPWRERSTSQARTITLAMDEQVKHSGSRSVRIENGDMRDIAYVQYSTERFSKNKNDPHNILPSRRYLLRWWVRGENIPREGAGPVVMMYVVSEKDGKTYRSNGSQANDTIPKGTFDWQQREYVFITDEHARWANFTFQLRWTTGKAWFDDVELIDLGPVVNVKTF